jgi:deoxyribodipyrimidine photo-lyase
MFDHTSKSQILSYIATIDPIKYERSRNSLSGSVTYLSPYITSGIITLSQVKDIILSKHTFSKSYKLIQELAWRDFFQSVYLAKGEDIFLDLKSTQSNVISDELPQAILEANTGITAIDTAIKKLYSTGYIHNHERMWLASIVCNIAGTSWITGAKWMYYYLLDGDFASNMLSWQWVAGTFSSKKYYANQENINKYTGTKQFGTFLDKSYEDLIDETEVPAILQTRTSLNLETKLSIPEKYQFKQPKKNNLIIITKNTINIDYQQNNSNHINNNHNENQTEIDFILHIDSDEQNKYPISQARLDFIIRLLNIELPTCKILICTKDELNQLSSKYKTVTTTTQPRMFPSLTGYYPSFFKFWDKASKLI